MKVLVLAQNDSNNIIISNVVKELLKRNSEVRIFSHLTDIKSIRMFCELGLTVSNCDNLTEESIEWCDIILSAMRAHINFNRLGEKIFAQKYIFVYNHYIDDTWYTPGADFMFTCGYTRNMRHMEDCARMAIGCPKNDRNNSMRTLNIENNILFIDSGHYPFSHKGKVQVADMLIDICKKFPNYTLTIKPRFLLTDTNLLHANYDHIYTLLDERSNGKIPDNLIMLNEHKDMQDLLDSCCCALMLCTSAYVDAALRGKNMVIVKGIDNEDKFELRNDIEYKNIFELRESSGCVVDIKDVLDYLPNGIPCNQEHLNQLVAYRTKVSEKMVNVMEYIHNSFLLKDELPDIQEYDYETYEKRMTSSNKITWDKLLHKRIKNIANDEFNILNRVTVACDYSDLYEFIDKEYIHCEISVESVKKFLNKFNQIRNDIWLKEKDKFMQDPLNQAELFRILYETQKYALLTDIRKDSILAKEAWDFYIGMISFQDSSYQKSFLHFQEYLLKINVRNFAKFECEEWYHIKDVFICLARMFDFISADEKEYAILYIILFRKRVERNSIPYNERKKLWEIALKGSEKLYQDKKYQTSAECMQYCLSESSLFMKKSGLEQQYYNISNSISYRLGLKVTWLPRKIRKFIKGKKFKNPIKQIKERYCNTIFYKMSKEFRESIMEGYLQYCMLIHEYGSDAYLHLSAGGTGDVYISSSYYNRYIEYKDRKDTAVYVVPGESCFQVTQLFDIKNCKMISKDEWTMLLHLLRFMGEPKVRIDLLYYHIFILYPGYVTWLESFRGWNLYNLMKEIHFPMLNEEERELPHFCFENRRIDDLFEENGLKKGRTVIFAPYAKWPPNIIGGFWEKLAEKLIEKGYTICTNSIGDEEPPIVGSVSVSFTYDVAVHFIETAGYIVGLRSGFLDIIESAKAKKVALYPFNCPQRGIANGTAMGSFSLNEMFQRDDWLELETKLSNLNEVIDEIMIYFEK